MRTRTVLTGISLVSLSLCGLGCGYQHPGHHRDGGGWDPADGGGFTGCFRPCLQTAADSYIAAVKAGDISRMRLAPGATYTENFQAATLGEGIWKTALPVDFTRSAFDAETCQSFTEVIVAGGGHPYVIGTRLRVADGQISEIESIVTDDGDWQFDANSYLAHSSAEDWSVIPPWQRATREELLAAANAYYDIFMDKGVVVPWGDPCARLEGGKIYTDPTCNTDVPSGIEFARRHFVIDTDLGVIDGLSLMAGENGLPDSHLFRVTNGTIRYVHSLTICPIYNCGM